MLEVYARFIFKLKIKDYVGSADFLLVLNPKNPWGRGEGGQICTTWAISVYIVLFVHILRSTSLVNSYLYLTRNSDGLRPSSFSLLQSWNLWPHLIYSSLERFRKFLEKSDGQTHEAAFNIRQEIRMAYGHPLSRSCGGLEGLGTSGPILSSSIQKYTYNICRSK